MGANSLSTRVSPIFGAAEVGRLGFVQGVRDARALAEQQFKIEQLLPLELQRAKLQVANQNFEVDRLNPLREENMRIGNRNAQATAALNEYRVQTFERENARRLSFEGEVMDDFNLIFDGEGNFDRTRGDAFLKKYGPRLKLDKDPFFKGLVETVRQEMGEPDDSDFQGRFFSAVESGDVNKLRRIRQEVALAPPHQVGTETRRSQIIAQLDDEITRLDPPIRTLTPEQQRAQRDRTLGLQGDLSGARLRESAQRQRIKFMEDSGAEDDDILREKARLDDIRGEVEKLEVQLGIRPAAGLGGPEMLAKRREIQELENAARVAEQRFIDSGGTDTAAAKESARLHREVLKEKAKLKGAGVVDPPQGPNPLLPPHPDNPPVPQDPVDRYFGRLEGSPFVSPPVQPSIE